MGFVDIIEADPWFRMDLPCNISLSRSEMLIVHVHFTSTEIRDLESSSVMRQAATVESNQVFAGWVIMDSFA